MHQFRHGWGVLSLLLLVGCGSTADIEPEAPESSHSRTSAHEVIVGSVDWQSSTTLSGTLADRAKAVGYLDIPAVFSRCTAWLASDDLVVTNNHCIANAGQAVGARVSFNYVDGVGVASRIWYDCSTFVRTWVDYDMTVLRCSPLNGVLPGQVYGVLPIYKWDAYNNTSLGVIHQNCDYYSSAFCEPTKKYSPGRVLNNSFSTYDMSYDADTLGGSSGSPVVYGYYQEVVALHHYGFNGNSSGRGTHNSGVKSRYIRTALRELGFYCGDNQCESGIGEDAANCAVDCTFSCGDGVCESHKGETPWNCGSDCDYCGNSRCGPDEDYDSCPWDCGSCDARCSDGYCCTRGSICSDGSDCL